LIYQNTAESRSSTPTRKGSVSAIPGYNRRLFRGHILEITSLRIDPLAALEGVDDQERRHIENRHGQSFGKAVAGGRAAAVRAGLPVAKAVSGSTHGVRCIRPIRDKRAELYRLPGEVPTRGRY
jgi:hypothetical protein